MGVSLRILGRASVGPHWYVIRTVILKYLRCSTDESAYASPADTTTYGPTAHRGTSAAAKCGDSYHQPAIMDEYERQSPESINTACSAAFPGSGTDAAAAADAVTAPSSYAIAADAAADASKLCGSAGGIHESTELYKSSSHDAPGYDAPEYSASADGHSHSTLGTSFSRASTISWNGDATHSHYARAWGFGSDERQRSRGRALCLARSGACDEIQLWILWTSQSQCFSWYQWPGSNSVRLWGQKSR